MVQINEFIAKIPKAELHVHLEGAIQPKTVLELAGRHNIQLPFSTEEEAKSYFKFTSLNQFLEQFALVCSTLQTSEDFATITTELGADSARQNILYREVFFTYDYHRRRGIPWEDVVRGLSAGRKEAKRKYGVELKFIADIDRTVKSQESLKLIELAHSSRNDVPIIGIGLDSAEIGHPPGKHREAFKRARELGFHVSAHAGEDVGPESVWGALRDLQIERIDHGVRSIEDDKLIAELVKRQIPLTVCPVSNILLKIYPSMADHPIKKLMDLGVLVMINSDDPGMFLSDVIDNYTQVVKQFNLTMNDIKQLAINSFKATFLDHKDKANYIEQVHKKTNEFLA